MEEGVHVRYEGLSAGTWVRERCGDRGWEDNEKGIGMFESRQYSKEKWIPTDPPVGILESDGCEDGVNDRGCVNGRGK